MPGSLLGQTPLIIRRENLADDGRCGLDDETANLATQLGEHARVFLLGRRARLGHDPVSYTHLTLPTKA